MHQRSSSMNKVSTLPIAILISGHGSNLQAIMDAIAQGLPAKIVVVISNIKDAYGLERARNANIPTAVIEHSHYKNRTEFDDAIKTCIEQHGAKLIVLAGFMRILGSQFVKHFKGHLINVHPSLLPKFAGLNTHQRVLESQEKEHGCSIHFVTNDVDSGPVIAQAALSIRDKETPETLKKNVHQLEHQLYPKVIDWFAHRRLLLQNNTVYLDGTALPREGLQMQKDTAHDAT